MADTLTIKTARGALNGRRSIVAANMDGHSLIVTAENGFFAPACICRRC